jgi:hypothetical protein
VDNKADVNFKDQQKYSTYYPLLNAVDYSEKSLSIVKLMLGLKADANVIGESGIGGYYNAFTRAIYNNNSCELLKLLISYGGDLKSHYYNSFEVLVTYSGNIETLKFFVEYFKQDQEIFPKLIKYFRTDSVDKAKYFLSQVDNPKKYEFDLLSHNYGFATFSDNCFPSLVFKDEDVWRVKKEIFNLMIEDYGFDINAKDEYGNSLLFSQIIYDNIEIDTASKYHTLRKNCLQLIIDLKADIDAANSKGQTILEHLTEYNISHIRFEKLKFLIKNKANLSVNGYKAAIKMFAKIDTLGIKDLFRKKVDDLNTPDKNDRTFLDVILMQFFKDITFEEFSQLQKNVVSKHLKNLIYVDNLVKLIQIGLKPNKMFAIEISKQNDKDLADEDKTYFNFNQDQKNFNNKMLAKGVFYDSPTTPSDNNNNDTKIDFSGNLNDDDNAIL